MMPQPDQPNQSDLSLFARPYKLPDLEHGRLLELVSTISTSGRYRRMDGISSSVGVLVEQRLSLGTDWQCVPMRSGTDALVAALRSADVCAGDLVVVPDFAYHGVGAVVMELGAVPLWVDVDEVDWNLSPPRVAEILEQHDVRAVVAVDNYGTPCDWMALAGTCQAHGVKLILDSCESLGGAHQAGGVAQFADYVALSFSFTKPIHSAGVGGALCGPREELDRARSMPTLMLLQRRMPEINAAYLLLAWPALDSISKHLNRVYESYTAVLRPLGVSPQVTEQRSSRLHAPFLLQPGIDREALIGELLDVGVDARTFFESQAFLYQGVTANEVSQRLSDHIICLPTGPGLSSDEASRIGRLVGEAVARKAP